MKKFIIKKGIKIAIIIAGILALSTAMDGLFNGFSFFKGVFGSELSIDKTANVVTQIKKISEFTTACYYEEMVIQKEKYEYTEKKVFKEGASAWDKVKSMAGSSNDASQIVKDSTLNKIVFIVKTKVRAGFDLSKIEEKDFVVRGDTLSVKLPEVEIFDIIANPSDWEIYYREGNWEDSEIRAIQSGTKEDLRKDAIDYGLLEKADSFGRESLISMFKTFGFVEVLLI